MFKDARFYRIFHYEVDLRLNWSDRSILGLVTFNLISQAELLTWVELDAHGLMIEGVWEGVNPCHFAVQGNYLRIFLINPTSRGGVRRLTIRYQGQPTKGLQYSSSQVFTAFHTSAWLVCDERPANRASLLLHLTLPAGLKVVANGKMLAQERLPQDLEKYVWLQDQPYPTYLFGFVAGKFYEAFDQCQSTLLRFYSESYSKRELEHIFSETTTMLHFFQNRSGVLYPGNSYTQALVTGDIAQEMSSFAVMGDRYGQDLLDNSQEDWLIAHELSHQWWGNLVTCKDWSDFWLNEGMATFMVAAYKEYRWGREAYEREMLLAHRRYERVRQAGNDRPLVHHNWSKPEDMSGVIPYNKGVIILDLLRTRLGDRAFWDGIRHYTQKYAGSSVRTRALQTALETTSGENLLEFFTTWVYETGLP